MKRAVIAIAVLAISGGAFALDVSGGFAVSGGYFYNPMNTSSSSLDVSSDLTNTALPLHAEVFFDTQYVLFGAGYRLRLLGHQKQTQTTSGSTTTLVNEDTGLKGYAAFSVYLKYPFALGQFVLFPLLGLERDINLVIHDSSGHDLRKSMTDEQLANEGQLWVKAGMGAQLAFSAWGYLRAQLLLGWKIPNSAEDDAVANAEAAGFDATLYSLETEISIAVGFNL